MNPPDLRIGLIGCGLLAERGYLPALRRAKGVVLAAVADPVGARCRELAPGAPTFAGAAELVDAGAADALVLATPAAAHLADARLAAAAGLPVLVEKPPAADAAEAAELARLDPTAWVGFNRRFEPELQRLRAKIPADGELELELEHHRPSDGWRSYVVRDDALLTLSPHLIDLARWLTRSDVLDVRAVELDPSYAELELQLGRGRAAISCATERAPRNRVVVRAGTRVLAGYSGGPAGRLLRRLARPGLAGALVGTLARQLEAFARAVRGGPAGPLGTAADGLAVMVAIEAARQSAAAAR